MEEYSAYVGSDLFYTQEVFSKYRPGGYHPITLGDCLKDGQYEVVHKLDWSGASTIWLASDKKYDTHHSPMNQDIPTDAAPRQNRWVSIKILTADASKAQTELRHLESLKRRTQGHPAARYIIQLLDAFWHDGPNGTHQCLVFELLGPPVSIVLGHYADNEERVNPKTAIRMSKQILSAVMLIHSAGFGHGDLSIHNVAFTSSHISELGKEELFELLEAPEIEPLVRCDGNPTDAHVPKQLVTAAIWNLWIDEDYEDIRILNFGEAFFQGAEPSQLAQVSYLQAPENIFTDRFDYRVDLWRLGCLFHTIVLIRTPFDYLGGNEDLVQVMIDLIGGLPEVWHSRWREMRLNSEDDPHSWTRLEAKFDELPDKSELQPLLAVTQSLLRYLPGDRISASQALALLQTPSRL